MCAVNDRVALTKETNYRKYRRKKAKNTLNKTEIIVKKIAGFIWVISVTYPSLDFPIRSIAFLECAGEQCEHHCVWIVYVWSVVGYTCVK